MYLKFECTITLISLIIQLECLSIHNKKTIKFESNVEDVHLKFEHVKNICSNMSVICKSNDSVICTTRVTKGIKEYLDFENSCFLFINNMCHYYGNEFSIKSSGPCSDYLRSRRSESTQTTHNVTTNTSDMTLSTKKAHRTDNFSALYDIDTAFDYHTCPLSCPDVYSPVCVSVNRGHGLYYKFYTFVNHCVADLYYCKHWQEFSPPPGESEIIQSSQLSWSRCAANRYIQFARFTEMTSSMGHYGWLAGDYRSTHIMRPHERMPGYG